MKKLLSLLCTSGVLLFVACHSDQTKEALTAADEQQQTTEANFLKLSLDEYQHLSPAQSCNRFAKTELPSPFAQGMGAIGLPGDYSSASRYVKAAFLKLNSVCEQEEEQQVMQFFHILDAVAMVKGSVITEDKQLDLTLYSCCISAGTKTYYYRTYENSTVHAIRMKQENMEGSRLSVYPLQRKTVIVMQN